VIGSPSGSFAVAVKVMLPFTAMLVALAPSESVGVSSASPSTETSSMSIRFPTRKAVSSKL
jgi:hypothetical protein